MAIPFAFIVERKNLFSLTSILEARGGGEDGWGGWMDTNVFVYEKKKRFTLPKKKKND